MEFHIKNMVCARCVSAVDAELRKHDLHPTHIDLGIATIAEMEVSKERMSALYSGLQQLGFELLDNAKSKVIDRIKSLVIEKVHHQPRLDLKVNWSDLISEELNQDYSSLSSLFSSVEGVTIEHYIIAQKVEKVKELLFYDEKNLSEIAFSLGYSSVQHLSSQFKKVTGQTPSEFKKLHNLTSHRNPLDAI